MSAHWPDGPVWLPAPRAATPEDDGLMRDADIALRADLSQFYDLTVPPSDRLAAAGRAINLLRSQAAVARRAAPPEPDARPPAGVDACSTRDFAVEHGQDFAEYLCAECPNRPKLARRMQEYSMRIMHDMLLKAEADRRTIHRLTQQLASETPTPMGKPLGES